MSIKGIFAGIQFIHEQTEDSEATTIQRVFRGFRARRLKVLQLTYPDCSAKSRLIVNKAIIKGQKIRRRATKQAGGSYLQWYTGPWPTRVVLSKQQSLVFELADTTVSSSMDSGWFQEQCRPEGWFQHQGDALPPLEHADAIQSYTEELLLEEASAVAAEDGSALSAVCSAIVIAEGVRKYAAEVAQREASRVTARAGLASMRGNVLAAAAIQQHATAATEINLQNPSKLKLCFKVRMVAEVVRTAAHRASIQEEQHAYEQEQQQQQQQVEEIVIDEASVQRELAEISHKQMSEIRVLLHPPATIRKCLMVRHCL